MLSQLRFITLLVAHILTSSQRRHIDVVQQLSVSLLVDAVVMTFPSIRLLMIYMIVIVIVRKERKVEIFSGRW